MKWKSLVFSILLLTLTFSMALLVYIAVQRMPDSDGDTRVKIVSTIFPVYDVANNIVGDKAEVVQILPSGVSPHTYEPSTGDLVRMQGADVVFVIGRGLDTFLLDVFNESVGDVDVVSLDRYVPGDADNPHYFTSVAGAKAMARVIMETLVNIDSPNADYYRNNYISYLEVLDDTLYSMRANLGMNPARIVTMHDAFGAFANELGIEVVATIEPFPGKIPTPQYLADVVHTIKNSDVSAIFGEPQLSTAAIETLVEDLGLKMGTLDAIGGYGTRDSFINNYKENVRALINAR